MPSGGRDHLAAGSSVRDESVAHTQLVDAAPESILVIQQDRITFLNAAARTLFQRVSSRPLLGEPFVECFHRDCQPNVLEMLAQVVSNRTPRSFEARLAAQDRSIV